MNWNDLEECKRGSAPSVPQLIAELEAKVKLYPNKDNATLGRLVFTRRRVKAPKGGPRPVSCHWKICTWL